MRILRTSGIAVDGLFAPIPKGSRIGSSTFLMWLSVFCANDWQLHRISTYSRTARRNCQPIIERKIWDELSTTQP